MAGAEKVIKNLTAFEVRKLAGVVLLCQTEAKLLEAVAKINAAWTDRTGHARQGLHAGADIDNNGVVLYIAHSVPYGIYLETSNAGKYAILKPTLEHYAARIKQDIQQYWKAAE